MSRSKSTEKEFMKTTHFHLIKLTFFYSFIAFSIAALTARAESLKNTPSLLSSQKNNFFNFLTQQEFSNLKETEKIKYIQLVRDIMNQIESSISFPSKKTAQWSNFLQILSLYEKTVFAENIDSSQYVSIRRTISENTTVELKRISEMFLFVDVYGRVIKERQSLGEKVPGSISEAVNTYWLAYDRMVEISKKPFNSKYEMDFFKLNLDQLEEYLSTIKKIDPSQASKASIISDFVNVARQRTKSKTLDPKTIAQVKSKTAVNTIVATTPTTSINRVDPQNICNGFFVQSSNCDPNQSILSWSFKIDDSTTISSENFKCQQPFQLCNPFLFGYEMKNKKASPICVLRTDDSTLCKNLSFDSNGEINQRIQNLWQNNPESYRNLRTNLWSLCDKNNPSSEGLKKGCEAATTKFNKVAKTFQSQTANVIEAPSITNDSKSTN